MNRKQRLIVILRKQIAAWVAFAIMPLLGGAILCGCDQEGQTQNETKIHDLATLQDLAVKNNASQDWQKTLTNKTKVFTIDVQDALLNKSVPLEFTGDLVDIRRDGGHIVAEFTTPTTDGFSLWLKLACTEDQRKILTNRWPDNYAIIAEIQKVMKRDGLTVKTESDEDGNVDQTFGVDWDADTYWVTGTCLDLKKLSE